MHLTNHLSLKWNPGTGIQSFFCGGVTLTCIQERYWKTAGVNGAWNARLPSVHATRITPYHRSHRRKWLSPHYSIRPWNAPRKYAQKTTSVAPDSELHKNLHTYSLKFGESSGECCHCDKRVQKGVICLDNLPIFA